MKALQEFFGGIREAAGAAFVVVQHLDPCRPSFTPKILARHSNIQRRLCVGACLRGRSTHTRLAHKVTRFFRDAEAWQELQAIASEPIFARAAGDQAIRVWVPGSATGEEAYTIGMLLMEGLRRARKSNPLQIFATDLSNHALDFARAGRYPQSIEADVPSDLLRRYFVRSRGKNTIVSARRCANPSYSRTRTCSATRLYRGSL